MQDSTTAMPEAERSPTLKPLITKRPGKLRRRSNPSSLSSSPDLRFHSDTEDFSALQKRLSRGKSPSNDTPSNASVTFRQSLLVHDQDLSHIASSFSAELQKLSPESKAQLRAQALKSMPSLPVPLQIASYRDEARRIEMLPTQNERGKERLNLQWAITHNLCSYGPEKIGEKYAAFRNEVTQMQPQERGLFEAGLLNAISALPRSERLSAFHDEFLRADSLVDASARNSALTELTRAVAKSLEQYPIGRITEEYQHLQKGVAQLPQAERAVFIDALLQAFSSLPNRDVSLIKPSDVRYGAPSYPDPRHMEAFFSNWHLINDLKPGDRATRMMVLGTQLPYLGSAIERATAFHVIANTAKKTGAAGDATTTNTETSSAVQRYQILAGLAQSYPRVNLSRTFGASDPNHPALMDICSSSTALPTTLRGKLMTIAKEHVAYLPAAEQEQAQNLIHATETFENFSTLT